MRPRYYGVFAMLLGMAGTFAIGQVFSRWASSTRPPRLGEATLCAGELAPAAEVELYNSHAHWTAMFAFETVVALVGVAYAVGVLVATARQDGAWRRPEWLAIPLLGVGALLYVGLEIDHMRRLDGSSGYQYLSGLLVTLEHKCPHVLKDVVWARVVGEPSGTVLAMAIPASIVVLGARTPERLGLASRRLQRLLYLSSLLFVAGIMMSRANFMLVVSQWGPLDEAQRHLASDLVQAGVVQSGVAYSGILALFYLPARALLESMIAAAPPESHRTNAATRTAWLKEHDLVGSWQDEARQIFALLAPIVSAPVFHALVKS